jgi:hypothetical protein
MPVLYKAEAYPTVVPCAPSNLRYWVPVVRFNPSCDPPAKIASIALPFHGALLPPLAFAYAHAVNMRRLLLVDSTTVM